MATNTQLKPRPLCMIANEILRKWPTPYFGAMPYITAMLSLDSTKDMYGADPGEHIVAYFLANAQTWRGADARRIKVELHQHLKGS